MPEQRRPPLPIERSPEPLDPALEEVVLHAFHVADRHLLSELIELIRDDELARDREPYAYRVMLVEYLGEKQRQIAACSEGVSCQSRELLGAFEAGRARVRRHKGRLKRRA